MTSIMARSLGVTEVRAHLPACTRAANSGGRGAMSGEFSSSGIIHGDVPDLGLKVLRRRASSVSSHAVHACATKFADANARWTASACVIRGKSAALGPSGNVGSLMPADLVRRLYSLTALTIARCRSSVSAIKPSTSARSSSAPSMGSPSSSDPTVVRTAYSRVKDRTFTIASGSVAASRLTALEFAARNGSTRDVTHTTTLSLAGCRSTVAIPCIAENSSTAEVDCPQANSDG